VCVCVCARAYAHLQPTLRISSLCSYLDSFYNVKYQTGVRGLESGAGSIQGQQRLNIT
jgi:hypothetical protein